MYHNSRITSGVGGRRNVLYTPDDDDWLSKPLCILRAQIEVFAATPDDVAQKKIGSNKPIVVSRVGIRCIHCAHLPKKDRARGAASFPISIRLMHQAVRNWLRYHFHACPHIPASIREEFDRARSLGSNSKRDSSENWVRCCERMGMVDATDGNGKEDGIRFSPDADMCPGGSGSDERPHGHEKVGVDAAQISTRRCTSMTTSESTGEENVDSENGIDHDILDALVDNMIALDEAVGIVLNGDAPSLATNSDFEGNESLAAMPAMNDILDPLPIHPSGLNPTEAGDHSDTIHYAKGSYIGDTIDSSLPLETLAAIDTPFDKQVFEAALGRPVGSTPEDYKPATSTDEIQLKSFKGTHLSASSTHAPSPDMATVIVNQTTTTGVLEEVQVNTMNQRVGRDNVLESIRLALELAEKCRKGQRSNQDAQVGNEDDNNGDGFLSSDEHHVSHDLVIFGRFLYKHFAGFEPAYESGCRNTDLEEGVTFLAGTTSSVSDVSRKNKRGRQVDHQRRYTPLRDMGFPVSLCIMVSSLLDSTDKDAVDRYKTADEVVDDLRLMTIDPERYLFDSNVDQRAGLLVLKTDRLYGREREASMLMNVFKRVIGFDVPSAMVLISGHSGTGKSVLVEQLRRPLSEKKGLFISVKFDELGQVQPMSAIFSAFDDFCGELLVGDEGVLAQVRLAIKATLGPHATILLGVIPKLGSVIGKHTSVASGVSGKEGLNQLLYYFSLFVRSIAIPTHSVVVFLDDLQWADEESLELLVKLTSDREARCSMFVGSYRDNEVGLDHPLKGMVGRLLVAGVDLTTMKLDNFTRESVGALVSDTLHLSARVTQSLADVTYTKTSGNPLFIVQFLRSLYDEHLLQYSARSRRWEWEVEAIQAKNIANNVVDLMTQKIQKLDPDVQWLLKVAACLGSQSEASTLKLLSSNECDDGSGIMQFFDLAVNEGLMSRMSSRYKFSHDQIQQAAYSLIPLSERDTWHLRIGRLLWKKATEEELKEIVFIVVDQLHRGSGLLSDHSERVEIASLCLMAGEKALLASSFMQASICLLQGTSLLEESDWRDHYDVSLRLFSLCAEAQYVTGNYDGVTITVNPILTHGQCLQDKLPAHFALLYSLGAQGFQLDLITHGLDLLAQLGETFPKEPTKADVGTEYAKTKAMLDVDILANSTLQMTEISDALMAATMELLSILTRYAIQVNQPLMALLLFRMVHLSLGHGICEETPYAFSMFVVILFSHGELEEAYQCGKLSLSLLERCKAKKYLARVYTIVYGVLMNFFSPMQANIPMLRHGYEIGMSMGDIEGALSVATAHVLNALQSGSQLRPLAEEAEQYVQQMKKLNHHVLLMMLPHYQSILNLMGDSEHPAVLTGSAMNQDELLSAALEKQLLTVTDKFYLLRMWLAYLFGMYDVAAEMIEQQHEIIKARPNRPESLIFETLYTGLAAVVMVHKGEVGKWRIIALEALEKLNTWVANSSWNFQHKLDLLNAETEYYLNGDADGAAKAYDSAISNAGEHGFVHEQALACERAGIFHSQTSSAEIAAVYFERAKKHYLEWGAKRKVEDICERFTGKIAEA